MYATPLSLKLHLEEINYFDHPSKNMSFLDELSSEETFLYSLGYIQACQHVQEALSDTKRRFLSKALADEEEIQEQLLKYVKLLDSLDESLNGRIEYLQAEWPE